MFDVIESLISALGLEVCDSISVPARRTSRARLPDSFVSGPAGRVPSKLFPREKGRLYRHQSQALRHLSAGRNVVISTGTASGKSLVFQLHAMNRLLADRDSKVLALYPLRALTSDQFGKWRDIFRAAGLRNLRQKDVAMIHREMAARERLDTLEEARVLLMTPDMCQAWLMNFIDREQHSRFLDGLGLLILDEAHVYESVFGSNMAFLVRRLLAAKRLLASRRKSVSKLQVIAATATIAEPARHLEKLTGCKFREVDQDGSPQREKRIYHVVGPEGREDGESFLAKILEGICDLKDRHRFIAFIDSRQGAERTARDVAERVEAYLGKDKVLAYRSGYEEGDRAAIEEALRSGELQGVVSTSALELGIDIPDMAIGMNLGVPRTRKSFRQRLGRIGRGSTGAFIIIGSQYAFTRFGETLEDYHESSVEPSHLYLENRFVQFAHARCLRKEMEVLGRKSSVPPGGWKGWPVGFREKLRFVRDGWPSEFDDVAKIGGDSPHFNYGLRDIGEPSYELENTAGRRRNRIGDINLRQAIREAYPGFNDHIHGGRAYRVLEWRPGVIRLESYPNKKKPPMRPDLRTRVIADLSPDGIVDGRLKQGRNGLMAEVRIRVFESVEGYRMGNKSYAYSDLHVDNPNMERKERVFSTTGVIVRIEEGWFSTPAVRGKIASGLHDLLCRDRSIAFQDIDFAHTRISVRTATEANSISDAIVIYDGVHGGLRLTESLFAEFKRHLDKMVAGADSAGDDPLVMGELAIRLQDWARTLRDDSLGAPLAVSGEIPEGCYQVYKPASTGEIFHNGVPTEVELIEPLYGDFFDTGSPQLFYNFRELRGNTDEPSPVPVAHGQVRPIGSDGGWVLWNPETGEYRDIED